MKNLTWNDCIEYIDEAIEKRDHTSSTWLDENGNEHCVDVGYVTDWWDVMKDELLRNSPHKEY